MSEDVDDVDQEDAAGDGDQPEMSDDEIADVDLDAIADEVEAEAGADAPDPADEQDAEEPGADDQDDEDGLTPDGESWGDMYVGTLTTVSNAIIEEHGVDGAEQVDEDLARQLHLDEYFDEWMASRGKSDMPPEQALLIATVTFGVMVVGTKTELPSKLLEEADF